MSKFITTLCTTICALSLTGVFADIGMAPDEMEHHEIAIADSATPGMTEVQPSATSPVALSTPASKPEKALFTPFTGRVKGKKVRMRTHADTDSRIIKELSKNDLLSIVGEKDQFWAVEAPSETKAYVFRSFVLEGVIEGNRVNIRLEPSLDAPIIGHLNSGDRIEGKVCAENSKWYEITPPANTKFYVAKDYVEYAGGPELYTQTSKRKNALEKALDSADALAASEMQKSFDEIDIERISHSYSTIINEYSDFPESVEQARESLAAAQESYIQKRISFEAEHAASGIAVSKKENHEKPSILAHVTDKMKLWEPVEEAIYLTWSRLNDDKHINEYYDEQRLTAVPITGILEPYTAPVKNKPGDYVIRENDLPVAYIYSTQVNLQDLVGKRITVLGTPRPNNNFAFPAYFALSVE